MTQINKILSDVGLDPADGWESAEEPTTYMPEGRDDLFRRWSMGELLSADRSFRWRARGLLVDPTYGVIGGAKKTLKSYISTFIDVGLATGAPVLGRFGVDVSTPVVAYVGEGGRIPWTRKLERVAAAMGVDLDGAPLYPSFDTAPVSSARFQETLKRDLGEIGPGQVTVDPWYAFHGAKTNAANLFEEGDLLTSLSGPCLAAGASLTVVTHFNKGGTGRGLDRLTMAGAQEWADSWLLLSHRETPRVADGSFKLFVEVGSRQWGGSEWELDLELGRFDVELGEFDGSITWELRRHTDGDDDEATRMITLVADKPGELTKEELAKAIGGNLQRMRSLVARLERRGVIRPVLVTRTRTDGRPLKVSTFEPSSALGRDETETDE